VDVHDPDADVTTLTLLIYEDGGLAGTYPFDVSGQGSDFRFDFWVEHYKPTDAKIEFYATDAQGNTSNTVSRSYDVTGVPVEIYNCFEVNWNPATGEANLRY